MRTILVLTILFNSAIGFSQSAELFFYKKKVNFGKTVAGESLDYSFEFKNKGKIPLVITKFEVECTCTSVTFPEYGVQPDDDSAIDMFFDTTGKIGYQKRTIIIHSNDPKSPHTLTFITDVKQPKMQ